MKQKTKWYNKGENMANLARYIIDKEGEIDTVYFLEKPWKWESEWDAYQISIAIDNDLDAFDKREK